MSDPSLGAVIGKFRTRNRNASLLTRFVNIETLAHQCMNQAGRWFYFGLCTIPGTNFVMHRHIIEEIGGWDPDALSEDTEISFRIYRMGYKIKLVPQGAGAVSPGDLVQAAYPLGDGQPVCADEQFQVYF